MRTSGSYRWCTAQQMGSPACYVLQVLQAHRWPWMLNFHREDVKYVKRMRGMLHLAHCTKLIYAVTDVSKANRWAYCCTVTWQVSQLCSEARGQFLTSQSKDRISQLGTRLWLRSAAHQPGLNRPQPYRAFSERLFKTFSTDSAGALSVWMLVCSCLLSCRCCFPLGKGGTWGFYTYGLKKWTDLVYKQTSVSSCSQFSVSFSFKQFTFLLHWHVIQSTK